MSTCNDNVRENFRNKSFPRYETMGRIRKVANHKFVFDGSNFVVKTKVYNFSKAKFKDIIRMNNKKFEEGEGPLPLRTNSVTKLVGVYKSKLRKMRFKPKYELDYHMKFFLESVSEDFRHSVQGKKHEVHPGSWEKNSNNLSKMATTKGVKYEYADLVEGYLSRDGIDLDLPYIGKLKAEYILGVKSKPNSYPGILTAEQFGNKRKFTIPFTKPVAYNYAKTIMNSEEQILDCSLLYVGGREKRMKGELGLKKQVSTRIVLGQEDVPSLISIMLSKILNEGFQKRDKGFNYGGRVNGRLNYRDLTDILEIDDRQDLNFNADFSAHDCMVHEPAIVTAFAMLRLCFDECVKIDRLFFYIMSGMVFKRIVLPESRLIYQISKGVATGHGMTNIITTLCSYGTFATGMNKTLTEQEIKRSYLVMAGDDVLGKMPYKKIKKLSDELLKNSGMVLDDICQTSGHMNSENGISINTFLKKKYTYNGLSWNDVELFVNLSCPTSTKLNNSRKIDNLKQMVLQAPFDQALNTIIMNCIILTILFEACTTLRNTSGDPPDELYHLLLRTRGWEYRSKLIDYKTLCNQKFIMSTSMTGYTSEIAIEHYIDNVLNQFRSQINERTAWFTLRRDYKSLETVVRLKVFDYNKKFFKGEFDQNAHITFDRLNQIITLYSQRAVTLN